MNYHTINECDMLNGEGVRVVLFVSGCEHKCRNCHNPQTHDPNSGVPFTEKDMSELMEALSPKFISGLTFSGGDPMHPKNRDSVRTIARVVKLRYPDKNIWMYTGYKFEDIPNDYLYDIDVLVDGRYVESLSTPSPKWRGSSNQRVIDVQSSLKEREVVLHCE